MSVNLLKISKSLFSDKKSWKNITDEEKELSFFIMNRNFSKKHPELSKLLNNKSIDKKSAMDTWFYYYIDKEYPSWFWKKSDNKKGKDKKEPKEIDIIKENQQLSEQELDLISKFYKEELEFELKLLKDVKKINK